MTQQEIEHRNIHIALMLGWYYEDNTWKILEPYNNGLMAKFKSYELNFHSNWNSLMEAIEYIAKNYHKFNNFKDLSNVTIFTPKEKLFIIISDFAIKQIVLNGIKK
jgi:hypothetical protein